MYPWSRLELGLLADFIVDAPQQQTRRGPSSLSEFEVHLEDMYVQSMHCDFILI